jgi:hypothetical protein
MPRAHFRHFYTHQVSGHVWHALLLLLLCDVLGGVAVVWPRRTRWSLAAAGALLAAGAYWARSNSTVEGGILLTITRAHGIVIADMLSVQAGLLALALIGRWWVQGLPRD